MEMLPEMEIEISPHKMDEDGNILKPEPFDVYIGIDGFYIVFEVTEDEKGGWTRGVYTNELGMLYLELRYVPSGDIPAFDFVSNVRKGAEKHGLVHEGVPTEEELEKMFLLLTAIAEMEPPRAREAPPVKSNKKTDKKKPDADEMMFL